MTVEVSNWLQNVQYPARIDRHVIERCFGGSERVFEGLGVTEATPTANFTVDVGLGSCVIIGDDQANQGMYLVRVTGIENVAVPASPGSGSRTDSVIVRVNDAQAGSSATPADQAVVEVIEGTVIPATAVQIATIARTAGEPAILQAAITDTAPRGNWGAGVTVASTGPTGVGVTGDLWVQY